MGLFKSVLVDLWRIVSKLRAQDSYDAIRNRLIDKEFTLDPNIVEVKDSAIDRMDWGLKQLGIAKVWGITKGKGIKIAILDTGVAVNHPDLAGKIAAAVDFTNDGTPMDGNGHGTHVAGIIAAQGINVTGVAPECMLYCGKVLSNSGSGNFDWIVRGVEWAIQQKVDIINMSLGSPSPYDPLRRALEKAKAQGIIVIAAAGNSGDSPNSNTMGYPARYDEAIAVGSVDPSMGRSSFSSVGSELDIMAPGGRIYSTWPPNQYRILQGTSMAAPYITGVCALILAKHRLRPDLHQVTNMAEMLEHLKAVATDAATPGWDQKTGWGIVDPEQIVTDVDN